MNKVQMYLFYLIDKWILLALLSTAVIIGAAFYIAKQVRPEYRASSKLHLEVTMQNFDPFATNVEFQSMKSFFESDKMFTLYVLEKEKILKNNPQLAARQKPAKKSDSTFEILKFIGPNTSISADSLVRALDTIQHLYKVVEKFRKKTTIKPFSDANVLEFSYKAFDPLIAYKVTDMIGQSFVREFTKEKRKKIFAKTQYLKSEIAELEKHLFNLKSRSTILDTKTKIDIDLTEKKLEVFYDQFVKADMELKEPDISAIHLKILAPALYNPKPVINNKILIAGLIFAGLLLMIWSIVIIEYFSQTEGISFFIRNASRIYFLHRFPGKKRIKQLGTFFEYLSGYNQKTLVTLCAFPGRSFNRTVSLVEKCGYPVKKIASIADLNEHMKSPESVKEPRMVLYNFPLLGEAVSTKLKPECIVFIIDYRFLDNCISMFKENFPGEIKKEHRFIVFNSPGYLRGIKGLNV